MPCRSARQRQALVGEESSGPFNEVLSQYASAIEAYPGYVPALQGAASLMLRTGKRGGRLEPWLAEIAVRGDSRFWREWASRRVSLQR